MYFGTGEMIYLNQDFARYWARKDPFEAAEGIQGEIFRKVKSRRTVRFHIDGKDYFAKIQNGVGWAEIIKNVMMFKMPVVSAVNEYNAICRMEQLGIETAKVAAFGERGINPAKRFSFVITEELTDTVSLEDFCREWRMSPPRHKLKKAILEKLAKISRVMHTNGINHRDYYICHFLLDVSNGTNNIDPENIKTFLLDLHRAQIRRKTPLRWVLKDISGLWFSAMDIGLTQTDILRFIKVYRNRSLRDILGSEQSFWKAVHRRACRLYRKETGKTYVG